MIRKMAFFFANFAKNEPFTTLILEALFFFGTFI